jgi:putative sigma-54 modulation protein
MQIGIQARGFTLTEALRAYCERKIRLALGSSSGKVRGALMRLTDENGPKGGIDKRCSIRVVLHEAPMVVVTQDETDLYFAIDRAADRMARTISRRLDRAWSARRAPGRRPGGGDDFDAHPY